MDKGWSGDILRQVWGRVGGFDWRHLEARLEWIRVGVETS